MRAADAALTCFFVSSLGLAGFARALTSYNKTFSVWEFLCLWPVTVGNPERSLNIVQPRYPSSLQIPIMGLWPIIGLSDLTERKLN